MPTITRIEITHHQLPLDPPFPASWDTRPRTQFPATIVRVFDDAGNYGIGSGDSMYGFSDYQRYFIGEDPLNIERHAAVLANIEFHAGRPWPLDVALWDLIGKIKGSLDIRFQELKAEEEKISAQYSSLNESLANTEQNIKLTEQ